jgi:CheY-like chemotaxis protein
MPSRAFIVDDDPATCELVETVMNAAGVDVLALTASAEAPARLRAEKFSLALFDMRMAAPDGMELARQARASGLNKMTPIILLSDDTSTTAVLQGFEAGATFFLYKPIDKSRLQKLIRATQGAVEHERRRFRRVPLQTRVQLNFQNKEYEGLTIDISLNGLLADVRGDIPAGSSVQVKLFLFGESKPVVGVGSVMRVVGGKMGIQLNQLSIAESGRLQDFLLPMILQSSFEATPAHA